MRRSASRDRLPGARPAESRRSSAKGESGLRDRLEARGPRDRWTAGASSAAARAAAARHAEGEGRQPIERGRGRRGCGRRWTAARSGGRRRRRRRSGRRRDGRRREAGGSRQCPRACARRGSAPRAARSPGGQEQRPLDDRAGVDSTERSHSQPLGRKDAPGTLRGLHGVTGARRHGIPVQAAWKTLLPLRSWAPAPSLAGWVTRKKHDPHAVCSRLTWPALSSGPPCTRPLPRRRAAASCCRRGRGTPWCLRR